MNRSLFYITINNMEEAKKIAKILVEEKLAACVNIIPGIKSFFYWEGKAQAEDEVLLCGKTRSDLAEELVEAVRKHHPYEVPCVLTWKLETGNPEFLEWIGRETKGS